MRLTFKYPVYPTKTQEETLFGWLDHLCELQNSARHDRLVAYETEGCFVSLYDQIKRLKPARETYSDFREVPQDMQCHALKRTDKAFANFRRRCAEGAAKKGYPRYKKRVRSLTWRLRKHKGKRENPIRETTWKHDRLKVPKLAVLRGERWVATLCETRNRNEARDAGLDGATHLSVCNAHTGFPTL